MVQITLKIWVSEKIFNQEGEYWFGDKKNELVNFTFCHKDGRETTKRFTYKHAIELAYSRARDGRYKNFTYVID